MKKKIFIIGIFIVFIISLFATSTYAKEVDIIKDNNFRKALLNLGEWGIVDTNGDGIITEAEARNFSGTLYVPFRILALLKELNILIM